MAAGWSGLALDYAAVQLPMLVALARGKASLSRWFAAPVAALPLMLVSGVAMAGLSPALVGAGMTSHGALHLAVGMAVTGAIGYLGGRVLSRTPPIGAGSHRRGTMIVDRLPDGDARARGADRRRGEDRSGRVSLAGLLVPMQDEAKHFKLIGTTGTGKSTAIQELMSGALARGDGAVFADPDGGYLRRFYDRNRGDVILNPFEPDSVKWNLFDEIESPYDADQLARSLIPDHDGADRSWRGYARTFFTAVTRQAKDAGITDVGELYRLLVVADAGELRGLVRGTPAQPFLDEHNAKMFDSIRSVTTSAVSALEYVADQRGPDFSVRLWVRERSDGALFMPYKAGQIAAMRSQISAWMRLAIFETMNRDEAARTSRGDDAPAAGRDGNRRLWFVIDELDALGQIDGLKDALARLRKFEGRCVIGFQSIAQVSSTYGHGDAHTIVENCGNTLILRCSASEGGGTARFASQLIGDREVLRTTTSTSRRYGEWFGSESRSEQFHLEPAILPSELEQLPDLAGFLKHASHPLWRRAALTPSAASTRAPLDVQPAPRAAGPAAPTHRQVPRPEHGADHRGWERD